MNPDYMDFENNLNPDHFDPDQTTGASSNLLQYGQVNLMLHAILLFSLGFRRAGGDRLVDKSLDGGPYTIERLDVAHTFGEYRLPGGRAPPTQGQGVAARDNVVQEVVDDQHGTLDSVDTTGAVEPIQTRQPPETGPQLLAEPPAHGCQWSLEHDACEPPCTAVRGQLDARHSA